MFWTVMLVLAATVSVVYAAISVWGGRLGIGASRLRLYRRSSWLAAGSIAVCLGDLYLRRG